MYRNLKAEMARKNINQKQLASMTNMSVSGLSLKMNGDTKFTFNDVIAIKKALGTELPLEELFAKEA